MGSATTAQDPLAVEERPEEAVAAGTPADVESHQAVPMIESAHPGGPSSGAPEQHPIIIHDDGHMLRQLRRPFTSAAVKWKYQSAWGEGAARIVGYIDARLVIERLNLIVGADWQEEFEPLASGLMICRLTVRGQTHTDVGEGKAKGLYSDAFKRAAVKFGVGVSVYAIPAVRLTVENGEVKPHKNTMFITGKGQERCTEVYEEWLHSTGIARFGEPIDHGDVAESAGEDVPEPTGATDLPDVKQPLTDERAFLLQAACREVYEKVDKRKLPKARFESELRQASCSHDELEAFGQKLTEMA